MNNEEVIRSALSTRSAMLELRDKSSRRAGRERHKSLRFTAQGKRKEAFHAWTNRCILHGAALAYGEVAEAIKKNLNASVQMGTAVTAKVRESEV